MRAGSRGPMGRATTPAASAGLDALRRRGAITETLFLFECETERVAKLRDVADRLGLTVQAVSHLYRDLARRGMVEVRGGRYSITVRGRAALQGTLSAIGAEVARRLERLQIVRTTRALAARPIDRGAAVTLELTDGVLTARPGTRGGSRGRALSAGRAGEIVDVGELSGIVPITPGAIRIWVVPSPLPTDAAARRWAARVVRSDRHGLLAAQGLEAVQLARAAGREPIVRFGAAAACLEASQLGVESLVFVTEEELPRFLAPFAGPSPPPITVGRLS